MLAVSRFKFLSSNTQDFIEVTTCTISLPAMRQFLSSNTQDFIEVRKIKRKEPIMTQIPEL